MGCQTGAGQPGTSSLLLGTGPVEMEGSQAWSRPREVKHGAAREAPDLLAEAVPLPPLQEASGGVGVCSIHPEQFYCSFMGNCHLNY